MTTMSSAREPAHGLSTSPSEGARPGPLDANVSMLWARVITEELVRAGVRVVAVAPGSRSAPLALALADAPEIDLYVHTDERAAAFFALGAAKASGRPAAVLTTSGTAAANLLPAAVEAHEARVPLVLVTADRPADARGVGAPQAIDQVHLFGRHALAYFEPGEPSADGPRLRALRSGVSRLVQSAASAPRGPVHLNVAFDEPLDDRVVPGAVSAALGRDDALALWGRPGEPFRREHGPAPFDPRAVREVAKHVLGARRGVIVCGPCPPDPALVSALEALARATGFPVLADGLSQARGGQSARSGVAWVGAYEAILSSPVFRRAHAFDLVVRLGAPPVSKVLNAYLASSPEAGRILVDPGGSLDPDHLGGTCVRAEPAAFCRALAATLPPTLAMPGWSIGFARAERAARRALDRHACAGQWEGSVVRALDRALPHGALLFVGASLAIRALDLFLAPGERSRTVLSNRGANGIDGVTSSALGAVAGTSTPGVLLVGDLSALHDAAGLQVLARRKLPLAIVCVNNEGGGIFHRLPSAQHLRADRFESLLAAPHGARLDALAAHAGVPYRRVPDASKLEAALAWALDASGPTFVEIEVSRTDSADRFEAALTAAREEVERASSLEPPSDHEPERSRAA